MEDIRNLVEGVAALRTPRIFPDGSGDIPHDLGNNVLDRAQEALPRGAEARSVPPLGVCGAV